MYHTQTSTYDFNRVYTQILARDTKKPTAHITKSKSRLKTYGTNVYLKDGSNFEIELFNPKTISVLAKIKINGKFISEAGLIIKPGQRVFLERFIDEAKKFVFSTYEIEDSNEAKEAIAENGKIEVIFYDQEITSNLQLNPVMWTTETFRYPSNGTGSGQFFGNTFTTSASDLVVGSSCLSNMSYYSSSINTNNSIETGRVEKGKKSSQEFKESSESFYYFSCATSYWQILPESKRPIESGEIRTYCTGCGTRIKKSTWKFCPNCGTSMNS